MYGYGFRVSGVGCRVLTVGYMVQGLRLRVYGFGERDLELCQDVYGVNLMFVFVFRVLGFRVRGSGSGVGWLGLGLGCRGFQESDLDLLECVYRVAYINNFWYRVWGIQIMVWDLGFVLRI